MAFGYAADEHALAASATVIINLTYVYLLTPGDTEESGQVSHSRTAEVAPVTEVQPNRSLRSLEFTRTIF